VISAQEEPIKGESQPSIGDNPEKIISERETELLRLLELERQRQILEEEKRLVQDDTANVNGEQQVPHDEVKNDPSDFKDSPVESAQDSSRQLDQVVEKQDENSPPSNSADSVSQSNDNENVVKESQDSPSEPVDQQPTQHFDEIPSPPQEPPVEAPVVSSSTENSKIEDGVVSAPSKRPNQRLNPRNAGLFKEKGSEGYELVSEDESPADHVDPFALQPSHTFQFEVGPNQVVEFFERIEPQDIGKGIRGDWFVTSGSDLAMRVQILDPFSKLMYVDGPYDHEQKIVSEGDFRFPVQRDGIYRLIIENPTSSSKTIVIAWLLGVDHQFIPTDTEERYDPVLQIMTADEFSHYLRSKMNILFSKIQELRALQEYASILSQRHINVMKSITQSMLLWATVETLAVIFCAFISTTIIKRFNLRRSTENVFWM
jgi:emp24/gp25L/p24 family/GOLD